MAGFTLGKLSELGVGEVRFVPFPGPPPRRSIILLRTPSGVRAYWNVCQHLPIPLDSGMGDFPSGTPDLVCLGHGARFTKDEGLCYLGPCRGRWLEGVPLEIDPEGDVIIGLVST